MWAIEFMEPAGPAFPARWAASGYAENQATYGNAYEAMLNAARRTGNSPSSYRIRDLNAAAPRQDLPLKDVKAALNSSVKPDITHVRTPLLNYVARNCEYGNDKYERANYIRATSGSADDFKRFRAYLRALVSHTIQCLDAMERHQANDPKLEDTEGMRKACFAIDTDADLSGKVGPSNLPHIGGAAASLNMALEQAVTAGLLPNDPGTPWKTK